MFKQLVSDILKALQDDYWIEDVDHHLGGKVIKNTHSMRKGATQYIICETFDNYFITINKAIRTNYTLSIEKEEKPRHYELVKQAIKGAFIDITDEGSFLDDWKKQFRVIKVTK